MVEYLRIFVKKATIRAELFLAAAIALAPHGFAQPLPDPTRPPPALSPAQEGNVVAPVSAPALQSVILSSSRKIAIINGRAVKLGEKYGDARVIKITETEVVLRTDSETQTLKLFPSIEKRTAVRGVSADRGSSRQ